jgi:hypothetical protein
VIAAQAQEIADLKKSDALRKGHDELIKRQDELIKRLQEKILDLETKLEKVLINRSDDSNSPPLLKKH